MGDHLVFERYRWFDRETQAKRFPNATTLAKKFEISKKTASRDIEKMRLRLGAPLVYDNTRKGYAYSDEAYSLSSRWLSQEEMLALLLARRILSRSTGGLVSRAIETIWSEAINPEDKRKKAEAKADESFSAAWPALAPVSADIFRTAADCTLNRKAMAIAYLSPNAAKPTKREVEPHHLQHYSGDWMLTAFCRNRNEWRTFHLGRMQRATSIGETFKPKPKKEWQKHLDGAFGIFQGDEKTNVVLRFNPTRARWIRGQIWHENQKTRELPDGSLELAFPVADFREVKLKILQFGSEVEVLEPEELRQEVIAEIPKMAEIYGLPVKE